MYIYIYMDPPGKAGFKFEGVRLQGCLVMLLKASCGHVVVADVIE